MSGLPYVLIKCAMSIDGYLDDNSHERLILSDSIDFDRVDEERSLCDAILLGASAVRKDNPRLLIRSQERRQHRLEQGLSENPIKVTMTQSGFLSKELKFFTEGSAKKIVYCGHEAYLSLKTNLENQAEIVCSNTSEVAAEFLLADLGSKGVKKLMIEGGSQILSLFLSKGLVDEIQLSIAPFFVGEKTAPSFVGAGNYIHNKNNRMNLEKVEKLGDMVLLTYKLTK